MKVKDAIAKLQKLDPQAHIAIKVWTVKEILPLGHMCELRLNTKEANAILERLTSPAEKDFDLGLSLIVEVIKEYGQTYIVSDVCRDRYGFPNCSACQHMDYDCTGKKYKRVSKKGSGSARSKPGR